MAGKRSEGRKKKSEIERRRARHRSSTEKDNMEEEEGSKKTKVEASESKLQELEQRMIEEGRSERAILQGRSTHSDEFGQVVVGLLDSAACQLSRDHTQSINVTFHGDNAVAPFRRPILCPRYQQLLVLFLKTAKSNVIMIGASYEANLEIGRKVVSMVEIENDRRAIAPNP
jgi:hypothetical protein